MLFLTLAIASIAIQGYSIYAYATVGSREADGKWVEGVWCYRVHLLDYVADDCWNLTAPDQYILEAIEHPGNWTEPFDHRDSTFWFIAPWYDHFNLNLTEILGRRPKPFLYNGACYDYDVADAGMQLVVRPLDEPPEQYWNLTNPDKYLLKAINNPGKIIAVPTDSQSIILEIVGTYYWPSTRKPFQYNGTYYNFSIGFVERCGIPLPKYPKPELTASALAAMWIAVGSIYIVKSRKTKIKP
jgi:hypothetical protein